MKNKIIETLQDTIISALAKIFDKIIKTEEIPKQWFPRI